MNSFLGPSTERSEVNHSSIGCNKFSGHFKENIVHIHLGVDAGVVSIWETVQCVPPIWASWDQFQLQGPDDVDKMLKSLCPTTWKLSLCVP